MSAGARHDYGRMPLFILSLGRYGVRQSYSLEAAGMTTGVSDNVCRGAQVRGTNTAAFVLLSLHRQFP